MATTDGKLALRAVQAVAESGARFAVVHEEGALARGDVASDVDLVVDRPVGAFVAACADAWVQSELWPLIVWPYDVGGTGTIFLATAGAEEGVQLDVLFDPAGDGQYGARSEALLADLTGGERFPVLSEQARAAYLLSKRLRKGELDRALAVAAPFEPKVLDEAVHRYLRSDAADGVVSFLDSGELGSRRRLGPQLPRLAARLVRPVGAWLAVDAGDQGTLARALAARFGRFLPHVRYVGDINPLTWIRDVAPVRWRAGVAVSGIDARAVPFRPDVVVKATSETEAARLAVAEMHSRALNR